MIHLACRHHIYELVLRSAVEVYWPVTSGPSVPIFKRFKENWKNIDTTIFQSGLVNKLVAERINDGKDEVKNFILHQLQVL